MNRTAQLTALALLAASGCRVFASNRDYSSYRAYRYESDEAERLAAGSRYLAENPRGAFSPRSRASSAAPKRTTGTRTAPPSTGCSSTSRPSRRAPTSTRPASA